MAFQMLEILPLMCIVIMKAGIITFLMNIWLSLSKANLKTYADCERVYALWYFTHCFAILRALPEPTWKVLLNRVIHLACLKLKNKI